MAGPFLQKDLGLGDAQLGWVFSAFTLAYALFEMPAGWMADRFGSRLMLSRVVLWWSLMTAATGWVGGFTGLLVVRLLFGAGEAGTFPGIARVYSRWLPQRIHGGGFGVAVTAGALGGAVAQPLTAWLLPILGWRRIFEVYALVGVLWAIVWYLWFRDDPHGHTAVNDGELQRIGAPPPAPPAPVPWKAMFGNRSLLALCAMSFGALYGWYFYLNWIPKYLLQARGFDLKAAGFLSALPLLSMALGVFWGGLWSDLLVRRLGPRSGRRLPGLIGFPLASLAIVGAIFATSGVQAALLLSLAGGAAAMGVAPAWAVVLAMGGRHAGVVSGMMNTFGNLGGALSPVMIGICLERFSSWDLPLLTVALAYLVSAGAWLLVDPGRRVDTPIHGA
jgi:ACS family glucarate transporter-like MFS transporter